MEIAKPDFYPDPDLSREEMEELQVEVGENAVFEDDFDFDIDEVDELFIAGIDQAFLDDKIVGGVVVMKNGEVIERVHAIEETPMPYIPGLLVFREGSCAVTALEKLSVEPDLLMFDGNGRLHYRQAGIATHIGLLFDVPCIGVAKKLLCGEPVRDTSKLEEGEKVPIKPGNRMNVEDQKVGYAYQTRQFDSKRINPVYVSSGHGISAETGVEIVDKTLGGYKLPEPTRLADKYVDGLKKNQ
ncbi:MAG: endonuclease V [Candidatus Aenigmatarchaeota archaeon]